MPIEGPTPAVFFVLAAITLASAICAMSLRNLVHCGLCLALSFAGLAAIYIQLNADFVGFAQILVYVGAVAILIVFTVLLTRNAEVHISPMSRSWAVGLVVAIIACASLVLPMLKSPSLQRTPAMTPNASVRGIGEKLMTQYVIPLEAVALVLTAALLGAVVIAMRDEPAQKVGRGVLTAPRPGTGQRIVDSDALPRRAEDSAPYLDADVLTGRRPTEPSSTP
jgi:NADH:ubiquinone oxidoreductase subunit 6 (subunit J)